MPTEARRDAEERPEEAPARHDPLPLPEENILYFLEKMAPKLEPWKREILRIVCQLAQYFYPQKQTKVMNEGCATYVHYRTMNRQNEKGMLSDGDVLASLQTHSSATFQPYFDHLRSSRIHPYALAIGRPQQRT